MVKKSSKKQDEKKVKEVDEIVEPVNEQDQTSKEAVEEKESEVEETKEEETKEEETPEQSGEEKAAKKLSELNDKYLRLSAEYDNYRRRTLKEKMELTKTAGESLILGLLPVIDDFDRALLHIDEAKDIDALKEGIVLIYNKFKDYLKQQGVNEIEASEKDFDTDMHEAVTKIPAPEEGMKGKVIDCIEKGYTLNDKVIRFSKVVVGE